MSDGEGQREPADHPLTGHASIRFSAPPAILGESSSITASTIQGNQTWSIDREKLEQKAAADAHRRAVELERLKNETLHSEHERKKDWLIFCLVVSAMAGGLVLGVAIQIFVDDEETKHWGQSLIILILGALGGYITGSRTN